MDLFLVYLLILAGMFLSLRFIFRTVLRTHKINKAIREHDIETLDRLTGRRVG